MSRKRTILFCDTEFTTLTSGAELISLALVDRDGRALYLESTTFDVKKCSTFVIGEVLPLLGDLPAGDSALYALLPLSEFSTTIEEWVAAYPANTEVAVDYELDFKFLLEAFGGNLPRNISPLPLMLDAWAGTPSFEIFRDEYFRMEELPQHHALHDARALRHAFLLTKAGLRLG